MIINFEVQQSGWFDSELLASQCKSFMTLDVDVQHFGYNILT